MRSFLRFASAKDGRGALGVILRRRGVPPSSGAQMSDWTIQIPYRERGEPLDADAVLELPRGLDDPEGRAVAERILFDASVSGVGTVGELLDQIQRASPDERRSMLDAARVAEGLETTADVDAESRRKLANSAVHVPRDPSGNAYQRCAAEGCRAIPTDRVTGIWIGVPDRKWWCPEHRHLAGPDDRLPPESGRIDPGTMGMIPPPSELARMNRERDELRAEDDAHNRRRIAAAEATRAARERYREQHKDDPYAFPPVAGIPQARIR